LVEAIDGVSDSLNQLGEQIQQLSQAQQEADNSYRFQNDPQMIDIANSNVAVNTATQDVAQNTNQLSNQSLQNALKPMSDATLAQPNGDVAVTDSTRASDAQDALTAINNWNQDYRAFSIPFSALFANFSFSIIPPNGPSGIS
jgi:hypothetical protein